jgi:hypothetical protein
MLMLMRSSSHQNNERMLDTVGVNPCMSCTAIDTVCTYMPMQGCMTATGLPVCTVHTLSRSSCISASVEKQSINLIRRRIRFDWMNAGNFPFASDLHKRRSTRGGTNTEMELFTACYWFTPSVQTRSAYGPDSVAIVRWSTLVPERLPAPIEGLIHPRSGQVTCMDGLSDEMLHVHGGRLRSSSREL